MVQSNYTLAEHRHRFAAWAAAQAARRALAGATNQALCAALDACSLRRVLSDSSESWPKTTSDFDRQHRLWCGEIIEHLRGASVEATYGRAAKLVAIYVKCLVVCGGHVDHPLASVAHPPVDSILLGALSDREEHAQAHRDLWASTKWTQLDEEGYFEVIQSFREAGLGNPFWTVEKNWAP